jgi:hypothetical protein
MADHITNAEFEQLLNRSESATLDFKRDMYNWSDEEKKLELVKDVLCMANTPREDPGYIVIGVVDANGIPQDIVGVSESDIIDEKHIRDVLKSKIRAPIPDVQYEVIGHNSKQFIVLRINVSENGPFYTSRDEGNKLRQKDLYFRDGTNNAVAERYNMFRIYKFFDKEPEESIKDIAEWDMLWDQLNELDTDYYYILVTTPLSATQGDLSALGTVPWVAVIDFDPSSDINGLLHHVRKPLTEQCWRSIHMITKGDLLEDFNPQVATPWFFARGLEGREHTLQSGSYRDWNRTHAKDADIFIEHISRFCQMKPVICLLLSYDGSFSRHLDTTITALDRGFRDAANFALVTDDTAALADLTDRHELSPISLSINNLCAGLASQSSDNSILSTNDILLPTKSGVRRPLPTADIPWFEEELEIIHLNIVGTQTAQPEQGAGFLQGAKISWIELDRDKDARRDIQKKLEDSIRQRLDKRRAERFNLMHDAGAGGTTVGRRLLWEFHERYPCVVLHHTKPQQTAERIERLTSLTDLPVLLLVDSADVRPSNLDELYDHARSRNIPLIILQTQRVFTPPNSGDGRLYLSLKLTDKEQNRFLYKYGEQRPERKHELEQYVNKGKCYSAFHFGLYTFHDDFQGIESFVQHRLNNLPDDQGLIFIYIALAYYYAQQAVPAQAFASTLHIDPGKSVNLSRLLPEHARILLLENGKNAWLPIHQLVAQEILKQVMTPPNGDRRNWKHGLSKWANQFAEFCRGGISFPSEEMLELARRAFIYRNNDELLGTERSARPDFSILIEDIKSVSPEGASAVLSNLIDLYPEEPHFLAHYGRFISLVFRDYQRAEQLVDRAIHLSERDGTLHHMKGMAIRNHLMQRFEDTVSPPTIFEIVQLVQRAQASFQEARDINPGSEHGYISEAQMLVRVLDYVGKQHKGGVISYLQSPQADSVLVESRENIENLLEHVRRNREGREASEHEATVRADLDSLFGQTDQALQLWNVLLGRQSTYKPPIRRNIIWTYLARRRRMWDDLSQKEIQRTIELLEANLNEEPDNVINLRLWIQAARFTPRPVSIEQAIEQVTYWRSRTNSLEAIYYQYVLYALQAIEGSTIARDKAILLSKESAARAGMIRHRTKSYEWLGHGTGLKALVHHSQLGNWDTEHDFWENTELLKRINGIVKEIHAPQKGTLVLQGDLEAFFVPAKTNMTKGKDKNRRITCYLGFSYDGLRAWDVQLDG